MFHRWNGSHSSQGKENKELLPEVKVNELRVALGPLSGRSLRYCTDACLRRFLEARNWNVEKAKKMLEETLIWRSTYLKKSAGMKLLVKVKQENCLEQIFITATGELFFLILKPGLQHEVAGEGETGKLFRADFHDRHGRTVLSYTKARIAVTLKDLFDSQSACTDASLVSSPSLSFHSVALSLSPTLYPMNELWSPPLYPFVQVNH